MKKKFFLALLLAAGVSGKSMAQAELQVIHNCADPAASVVDIYVNGTLTLDDFGFREATPFLQVPSGVTLNLGIAPGSSTSANDTLVNIQVTLNQSERYVAIASGVLSPATFAANPDAISTGFQLILADGIRNAAINANEVDFKVLHGSTDAPTVDVIAQNVATLVNDAAYTDFTGYISVPAADYLLDITPGNNNSTVVATFAAPLTGLAGGAAVVFASGFLNPAVNNNGASFGLFAALPNGSVVALPAVGNARLQIIHNSPDPAAATVDVYVNGSLTLDDFAFRSATPFIDINSGVTINIGIAPGNSTSINDTLVNIPVVLNDGETYVAVASGVLNPSAFAANPDGASTAFQLLLFNNMQELAVNPSNVEVAVLHGSTDAPTVDIYARNSAQIVNDASYTNITPYVSVPANNYLLDVTPAAGSPILVTYDAPVLPLGGAAAVVFASGFLDPAANQNGAAFGVFVAFPNGLVLQLNDTSVARLQVIHNAADPAAANVDVYVNGGLLLDNFAFRTATPYISVPGDAVLNIGIAPSTSTSAADTLVNIPVTLSNGEIYVAIANGVLNPASFAGNPNAISTGFQLLLSDGMRESALNNTEVDFRALHGATDAPTVDIKARNVATLVNGASYTDFTSYISVPASDYILDICPAGSSSIVASFSAPLSLIPGSSAVVFASGFLDPTQNQNGESFGLFAALRNGSVVPFTPTSAARLQVIHNCADPAADSVDVYVNGTLALDNFAFRNATPYIDVPGDVNVSIGVAGKNSASVNDTLVNFDVTFSNGETYAAIASGVLSPSSFAANPDGRPTGFNLILQDQMRETAISPSNVEFRVMHGATDAPTVDVVVPGFGPVVNDLAYTDITAYSNTFPGAYTLQVTPANNNNVVVAAFNADISSLAGQTAFLFASGFLDPTANQNGSAFGLFAALTNGTVVEFPIITTGMSENNLDVISSIFPNPAGDFIGIEIAQGVTVESMFITDLSGKVVQATFNGVTGNRITSDVSSLASGMYMIQIVSDRGTSARRLNIVR